MARTYIRKTGPCAKVPKAIRIQIKYKLMDYDRLVKERFDIMHGSPPPPDGMPRGGGVGKPTEEKAVRLAMIDIELKAIDQSASEIRGEYDTKVHWDFNPIKAYWSYDYYNYMHIRKGGTDEGPSRRTWNRYKDYLTYKIAKKLKLIL